MARPKLMDIYTEIAYHIQYHSRLLLSSASDHEDTDGHDTIETNGHYDVATCQEHEDAHDIETAFQHIYFVMLFMACLWFVGKLFARCGLPTLVGEILCGIVLGPNLLNFVPYSDALIVIGEIGLVLLVLEAGIDVSIGHLKVVGCRGLFVAVFGSMIPLGIGTGLAWLYGNELQSAFAIGACLAPTSMGIALNVLRNAKVLNTPTGQLIIAAAVLDDVIALMLLSELEAMADPTVMKILLPLIVSPLFIIFFGALAIKVTPWLIQKIMIKTNKHQHENVILLLLFVATFSLIPICFYAGSSHLLGAFLAGLMFCTDHTIHEAWNNQIKRLMQWMLRVFFACTIGFAVPIQDFWAKPVLIGGFIYFCAIVGKILTGIFAKPLCVSEFFTIGFAMSAWGEFAFILATASYNSGSIDKDSYSSVLMAVLLSVVVSPLCLRATLVLSRHRKTAILAGARDAHYDYNDETGKETDIHPVYFCVHTKGRGKWGHQDKLLHCIFNLHLEIIDFRAFNEAEYNYTHHMPIVQDVFYILDTTLKLPPSKRLDKVEERKLQQRYKEIKRGLKETMADPLAVIDVMRWLPGVRRDDDDEGTKTKSSRKKSKTVHYCRKEAYKQARLALDNVDKARSSSYIVSGVSRIRPTHDALYRDKFTYHGGIHTEQDDLIAMTFLDTLTSIQASLSPQNRASPTGSEDGQPLNTDELFEKINTLRSCVEQLPIFQAALSDDGREVMSNASVHSVDGLGHTMIQPHAGHATNARSFDAHYARTFNPGHTTNTSVIPLHQPNISAESVTHEVENGHDVNHANQKTLRKELSEHGSILGITHSKTLISGLRAGNKPHGPPPPGLFLSHSHGVLPASQHHAHPHPHSPFYNQRVDVYPRDAGSYPHTILTQTHSNHSSDHNPHISSEESASSTASEDMRCATMYADEDANRRPLGMYTNLQDLDEEEDDEEDAEKDEFVKTVLLHQGDGENNDNEKKKAKKRELKRSSTWSKMKFFSKHKKLSDSESEDSKIGKRKRKKRKNKKERQKSKEDLSSSSAKAMSWLDEDIDIDPKMIEVPKAFGSKKKLLVKSNSNLSAVAAVKDDDEDDNNETQPLKAGDDDDDNNNED